MLLNLNIFKIELFFFIVNYLKTKKQINKIIIRTDYYTITENNFVT